MSQTIIVILETEEPEVLLWAVSAVCLLGRGAVAPLLADRFKAELDHQARPTAHILFASG